MSEEAANIAPVGNGDLPAPGPARAAPARRPGWLLVLAALAALVLALVALWRVWLLEHGRSAEDAARIDALSAQVDALSHTLDQRKRDLDALRARVAGGDDVNKGVREELLALGERSRHLEDAVANLSEQRLTGRDALALNEAEFVLQQAQERLALFQDAPAAAAAYRLADSALAAAEDPVFASVRRTITAEREALDASRPADMHVLLGALAQARAALATLPPRKAVETESPSTATPSRWQAFIGQFVRISHDAHADAAPTREPGLARSLATLDLRDAEAAALARDVDGFRAALARARTAVAATFDADAAPTRAWLTELDRLAATPLAANLPELGTALKELRNLRATRAIASPAAPAGAGE